MSDSSEVKATIQSRSRPKFRQGAVDGVRALVLVVATVIAIGWLHGQSARAAEGTGAQPTSDAGDTANVSDAKEAPPHQLGGGEVLRAHKVEGDLPIVPDDKLWSAASEHTVPLVSQTAVAPSSAELKRSEISVRALYNKSELALLMVLKDSTEDSDVSRAAGFSDAVAVGFPTSYGDDIPLPYIGMGNAGRPVNIWQWKAAWQSDIENGFRGVNEAYPNRVPREGPISYAAGEEAGSPLSQTSRSSSVENLVAEGFGTLTSTRSEGLQGNGVYKDGTWHVVMKRPLKPKGVGTRIATDGALLPITFAVWDGSGSERNGMKGLTRWRFMAFGDEAVKVDSIQSASEFLSGTDPEKGKTLVVGLGCPSCHTLPGQARGGNVGPDLSHAGAIHRPDYLFESIIKPNAIIVPAPGYFDPITGLSTMPSFYNMRVDEDDPESPLIVSEKDFRDMTAYLWSLQ